MFRRNRAGWYNEDEAVIQLIKVNEYLHDILGELESIRSVIEAVNNSVNDVAHNTERI